METVIEKDIVIVGAGIAGLTTSLGLHRYSFSLYLYSDHLFIFLFSFISVMICLHPNTYSTFHH